MENNTKLSTSMSNPDGTAWAITKVVKEAGQITGYELSSGHIVSKEDAITMAKNNQISGVTVSTNQGTEYLRSLPDQQETNNLSSLPVINTHVD